MRVLDRAPRPHGYVQMWDQRRNEDPVLHHEGPNLCVHGSREILANLLTTGLQDTSDYYINKLKLGNRGEDDDVVANPSSPLVTDTDLAEDPGDIETISGANVEIATVENRVDTYIWIATFKFTFDYDTGHDPGGAEYKTYTEMGMYSDNDTLFAKKHFPSYIKTADRKLIIFWTIAF